MILGTDDMSPEKYSDILEHGDTILSKIDWKNLSEHPFIVDVTTKDIAEWSSWRLILNGDEFRSKFKNFDEWSQFYSSQ